MTRSTLGILVGLALGAVLVFGNFGDMLIVALFAIIGFVVGKVLDGDIDLTPYLSGRRSNR
ncbi:MAG: DUF2273 domain-containing protein [Actinomycetota bacterium]|nr:DUF2273 domain-containing protein [Actinomycetota bacterium]